MNDLYTMVKPCEIFHNPTNHHLWREEAVVTWSLLLLGEDGEGTKKTPKNAAKATWTIDPVHGVTLQWSDGKPQQ